MPDLPLEKCVHVLHRRFPDYSEEVIASIVSNVGGRLTDLNNVASKLGTGMKPSEVIISMVQEAELAIRNQGFGGKVLSTATVKKWNQVQLWKAMKQIVSNGLVKYDDLLFSAFSGDNEALKALIKERILSIQSCDGTNSVCAYSNLYLKAFEKIVNESPKLRRGLDILEKKTDIAKDIEELNKVEEELIRLKKGILEYYSENFSSSVSKRREQLFRNMKDIAARLEKKEAELKALEAK